MKHKIILLLILIFSVILVNFHLNKQNYTVPNINKVFPKVINEWTGSDYIASKDVYNMIPQDKMLLRIYKNSKTNQQISVAIVLSDKRDHIHDPNVCYQEQGFDFSKKEIIKLSKNRQIMYVNSLKKKQKINIYYWYTDLENTYPGKIEFLKHAMISKLFDKQFKGYGFVIVISPHGNVKEIQKFNIIIDSILQKI